MSTHESTPPVPAQRINGATDPHGQGPAEHIIDLTALRPEVDPDGIPVITTAAPGASEQDTDRDTDPDAAPDEGDVFYDRESVVVEAGETGRPVDTDEGALPPELVARQRGTVKPIVPEWAKTWPGLYLTLRWHVRYRAYVGAYHATRSPLYAARTGVWAPVGLFRTTGRLIRWATAEEGNWGLRQVAATRGDADTWLKLDRQRQRQSVWRWWVTTPTLILGLVGLLWLFLGPMPLLWRLAVVAVLLPVLARAGKGADGRITDRVIEGAAYRRLTADLVRRALTSLGISDINSAVAKDPGALSFPTEIHRDGPGHLAVVDLPFGVEATQVIARRGRVAAALRLPLDQVWPEPASRAHPGQLHLWVGHEPASAMRQPTWPLLSGKPVDLFAPFPFATDPRLRPLAAELMYRNWLFGGQPGSGKTFALRLLVLAAALDPRAELRVAELKGVGDFRPLEPVLTEYHNGFGDDTIAATAAMCEWLYEECLRRSKRIDFYAAKGMCPENKVTPELASLKGSGLHPLVVAIDEIQNLFLHDQYGKAAGEVVEKVIKLGRALGIVLVIGTQIPDKSSLPPGITRNVNTRFCLSVRDQVANDMILGTGMYKAGFRATVFEPVVEAGWGVAEGLGKPGSYRSFYVATDPAKELIAHAVKLRGAAGTLPLAPVERETAASVDLLADLLTVWPADVERAWNEELVPGLVDLRPEVYGGWAPAQLTSALKPHRIEVDQIGRRVEGKTVNRRGPDRADVLAAVTKRSEKRGTD